jgi:magnesium transporter
VNTHDVAAGRISVHEALVSLRDDWRGLSPEARLTRFRTLGHGEAESLFLSLGSHEQADLLSDLPADERRLWIRDLDPDDAVDVVQNVPDFLRAEMMELLDPITRSEVKGLLAYAEDDAGGLMSPRFSAVRADMTIEGALAYLRRRAAQQYETTYYVYVLEDQHPIGVVSIRNMLSLPSGAMIRDAMHSPIITVPDTMDQEEVSRVFADHDLLAIPVVDVEGRMKGIVTVDDIVHVVREEATEDAQKFGGMEALDLPYLDNDLKDMVRKRAGWLSILFVSEMLTATAMGVYQDEIQRVVLLALFIPLIISSGGNSGSQASTLVIRAMALGEVRLVDWWRVAKRELVAGLTLGLILGVLGFIRIAAWQAMFSTYGEQWLRVALTVSCSLVGVVLFGSFAGSMLPFALKRAGLDPASASGPFVATLVDVTGIVIYFTFANFWLGALMH